MLQESVRWKANTVTPVRNVNFPCLRLTQTYVVGTANFRVCATPLQTNIIALLHISHDRGPSCRSTQHGLSFFQQQLNKIRREQSPLAITKITTGTQNMNHF